MSNNISRRSFIGGSGLLALALAGCGGNSGGGSSEEFSFDGTVFSIATDTIFAPFEYTEADGTYVGIDIDILATVAAVQSGQADGMIAGMSITEERKETFDFSDPYYDSTVCAATKADNPAATLYDLDGQTVAVKTGTQSEKWANSVAAQYGFTTVQFDDSDVMYQDVLAGNTAACFEDTPIMTYAIATGNVDLKIIAQVDSTSEFATPYGFAVKKGENAELLAAFNAGLATIKGDGTYQEIIDKYMTTE